MKKKAVKILEQTGQPDGGKQRCAIRGQVQWPPLVTQGVQHWKITMEKSTRGNASQFYIAGELCRRGYSAVVTMGNTPNTDILCSNLAGTKFVHIQVKTFIPGGRTCSVGAKAEIDFGERFFWVLGGIPQPQSNSSFEYFIIPSRDMASMISEDHSVWLKTPGKKGQAHNPTKVRTVHLPPYKSLCGWDINEYSGRWDLIEEKLRD